jgi:uncharacterized glyoxalase superfamily protein PhnB
MHNRSFPPGTVIPELAYPDVGQAVAWLCRAFGFRERLRIADHRAQLTIGRGSIVVIGPREVDASGMTSHSIMVQVEDVASHCERARTFGARIVREPADHVFGERQYTAEDLAGHVWTFSQSIADVHPKDWGGTLLEE